MSVLPLIMAERLADLLNINPSDVGIKAKTPEGMGTDNAAIAHVVVLLQPGKVPKKKKKR